MRLFLIALLVSSTAQAAPSWQAIGKGLELATFAAPLPSSHGDSRVTVVRIDPTKARFTLLSANDQRVAPMTARQWADQHKLRVVINAGMFHPDRRPVGYMRHGKVEINPTWNKDNTLFAFNPRSKELAKAQVIDRGCDGAPGDDQYDSVFQGIRIIDCTGKITWAKQPRKWSLAVMGQDQQGRILFIHSRSPYPVHDFAKLLKQLPLGLRTLMYLEGGPEASLFVRSGSTEVEHVGSYETGFFESDENHEAWALPNVVGVLSE